MEPLDYRSMKRCLGLVVPVWFPAGTDDSIVESSLRTVLIGWERYFEPESIVLSIDGCPEASAAVKEMADGKDGPLPPGVRIVESTPNRGKGHAVAIGFRKLLEDERLRFFLARDVDGDHLMNDLENLYRIALQAAVLTPEGVLVAGRRHNLRAPLGFERAEFEIWVNRCLFEALQHRLARDGRVVDRRLCSLYADVPDFQSGYKLYSRSVVEQFLPVVLQPSEEDRGTVWRSSEVVPVVEAVLMGAQVAEITRMTAGQQPVSGFGRIDRAAFYGEKLAWAFRRLEINPRTAAAIVDNHMTRSELFWTADGRRELLAARTVAVGGGADPPIPEII